MSIKSPLTCSDNVSIENEVPVAHIIQLYKDECKIDVARFFKGIDKVTIARCNDTGYRFYYPLHLSGDGEFYEQLQLLPGYYPRWKWEHSIVKQFIKSTDTVLEIGCAEGSFLDELSKSRIKSVGLELNQKAVEIGRRKGLDIFNQSVQDHCRYHKGEYDIVCSFQVMEHIALIKKVLQDSVNILKPGGTLFIAVPNNDSFILYDEEHTLNLPPHHMGLWNKKSLQNLENLFPIKFEKVFYEDPLPVHRRLYNKVVNKLKEKHRKELIAKYGAFARVINGLLKPLEDRRVKKQYPTLQNFTIVAKYRKHE